jgi:hypothetical protein
VVPPKKDHLSGKIQFQRIKEKDDLDREEPSVNVVSKKNILVLI